MKIELWSLLWSQRQNCLHIEPLERSLSKVRAAYAGDISVNDYHVLHVGPKAEVEALANSMRQTINARDKARQNREPA